MNEKKALRNLFIVGVIGNIVLAAFKFVAGFIGSSVVMITDAIHSTSDIVATFIAYIGAKIARKDPDKKHPYGHERYECLAALILGIILIFVAINIVYKAVYSIASAAYLELETPATIALIAALVSIVLKEAMFWYTMHYAKRLKSSAFKADAWHHRSDAISSVAALIGIVGGMCGVKILDPIVCLFIAVLIAKVGFDIIRDGWSKLVDTSCGEDFEKKVRALIEQQEGVEHIDVLMTRKFGEKEYIDADICVDGNLSLFEAHEISQKVHDAVEAEFVGVKHIMIHVNPATHRHE